MDEASLHIDAPAEELYDLVSDITQMGRWSPECLGGRWRKGATGPAVGAKFTGRNKNGFMRWTTHCTITKAERGKAFEFEVFESGMRWGYRFEPDGDGTLITEYREQIRKTPPGIKLVQKSGIIGKDRENLMVEGMRATLAKVKAAAEDQAA